MPAGGRISRRDNLRGKVSSQKSEPNVEAKVPGLKLLSMLKEKNADKKSQLKKDIINEGIREKETDNSCEGLKRKNSRLHNKLYKPLDIEGCPNKNEKICDKLVKIHSNISPNKLSIINTSKTNIDLVESKLRKESPEKIHSNIEEGIKRRNAKKENMNEMQSLFLNPSKLCATTIKSKMLKKDDLIKQIEIVQEDKISNNELKTTKEKGRKSRLLLKENVSETDEMTKEDEVMVKIEVPMLCIEDIKTSKLRGKKPRLLVSKNEEDRINEVVQMEIGNEISSTKEIYDKKEVKKTGRPSSKLKDKTVPFVVEPAVSEKSKIPGLAFLQNLKDRKSIISTNTEDCKSKIPGLSSTAEIRRRKSQFVSESMTSSNNAVISLPEIKDDNKSPKGGSEIIPGLSSTAEIRRRKSVLEVTNQQCKLTTSEGGIYSERDEVLNSLSSKRQRKSIFDVSDKLSDGVNTKQSENVSKDIRVTSSTAESKDMPPTFVTNKRLSSSYKVKTVLESPKVPGLSVIEEIRSRKSAIPTQSNSNNSVYDSVKELLSTPLTAQKCLSVPPVSQSSLILSSAVNSSLILTEAPSNIFSSQSLSRQPLSSVTSTTSRLSSLYRSSPSILKTPICNIINRDSQSITSLVRSNKRPMSCLSNDNEDIERREKIARTLDVEQSSVGSSRRQSVTFNNRVEVKEIKGNSFSSDKGDIDGEVTDESKEAELAELERKVKENMEKTKLRLVNKRLGESVGNIFSVRPKCQTNISRSSPTSSFNFSGISQKSSGLSDYMIGRKRAQFNLSGAAAAASNTSSMYNFNNANIKSSNSGPQSTITSTVSGYYDGSRSLSKEDEPMKVDDMSNEISDDEMDEEERNKKDKCTIL